jgi:hypothetical protein
MGHESAVVLFKGGRVPGWYGLTAEQHDEYQRIHVDLMLDVAREHGMTRIEGYRLVGTQQFWRLFWIIEFPTVEGAEAWIAAEVEPPYGAYGNFEYHLGRRWAPGHVEPLVTDPPPLRRRPGVDPHEVPALDVDRDGIVVLSFGRHVAQGGLPESASTDEAHARVLEGLAGEHGLTRLEGFRLLTPQPEWHWAYVAEFPAFGGAEAWIEAEMGPDRQGGVASSVYLARRWAPEYFDLWPPG